MKTFKLISGILIIQTGHCIRLLSLKQFILETEYLSPSSMTEARQWHRWNLVAFTYGESFL